MRITSNDISGQIHQPHITLHLPLDDRASSLIERLCDVTPGAADCALGLYLLAAFDAWPEREGPSELAGRLISLCDASGEKRFEVDPEHPPRIGTPLEEVDDVGVRVLRNDAGEFGIMLDDTPIWIGTNFWEAVLLACRGDHEQSPADMDAHVLENLWEQFEAYMLAEIDSVMEVVTLLAGLELDDQLKVSETPSRADMVVIDMTRDDIDTIIDMDFVDDVPVADHINKSADSRLAVDHESSSETLAQAAKLGEKVLRDTLLRVGTQVFQRTLARALDEMLQGAFFQGTQLEGLRTEDFVRLKDALKTFNGDKQLLPERLQRLTAALARLPDDALLGYRDKLIACVKLCSDATYLLRDLAVEGMNPENARRVLREVLSLLDNPLLSGWSAVESLRNTLPLLDQGLTELSELVDWNLSFEGVLGWVKSSSLVKGTLGAQYQGAVQVFDELGTFCVTLKNTRVKGTGFSPLLQATELLLAVDNNRLGPLLTSHLHASFTPFFDALHALIPTLAGLKNFPVGQPSMQQLRWLGECVIQTAIGQRLPDVLLEVLKRGVVSLGNEPSVCKSIGQPPKHGSSSEQAKWLLAALDQPIPPEAEKQVARAIGQEQSDSLNFLGSQIAGMQSDIALPAEGYDRLELLRWVNALTQNIQANGLLELLLPESVSREIIAWSTPLLQVQRLTLQLADYPNKGEWYEKFIWMAMLLTSNEVPALLQQLLPESLAKPLVQPFEMIRQTTNFPSQGSSLAQSQWALNLLGRMEAQVVLKEYAPAGYDDVFAHFSNLVPLLEGVDMLRGMMVGDASRPIRLQGLGKLLMQPLIDELKQHPEVALRLTIRLSGGTTTTVGVALTALLFYLEMPGGLSRNEMIKYGSEKLFHQVVKEFGGIVGLAGEYGSPALKLKEYIQQTWELYKAWSEPGSERMERELDVLATLLKRDLPLSKGMKPLLDVLPALPALLRARAHYSMLPDGMPLSGQASQMVAHLAQGESAALARLYDAIEAYAVDGMVDGLDHLMTSMPDVLKFGGGVDAASLTRSAGRGGHAGVPQAGQANTLAWAQALGGLAGLVAAVAGGIWVWRHDWDKQASTVTEAGESLLDPEERGLTATSVPVANLQVGQSQNEDGFDTEQVRHQKAAQVLMLPESREETKALFSLLLELSPQRKAQLSVGAAILGGVISGGFMLNGVYGLLSKSSTVPEESTLDIVETETRADFYAGNAKRLQDDIDRFLTRLETELSGQSTITTSEQTVQEASASRAHRRGALIEHQESVQESAILAGLSQDNPAAKRVRRSENGLSIDQLLPLMKEAHELIRAILAQRALGNSDADYAPLLSRLGQIKNELVQLREDLANLGIDWTSEWVVNQEVYAYYLLAEMKAYYSDLEVAPWHQLDSDAAISYCYTNLQDQQVMAHAPLIDFLNGRVTARLESQGISGGFDFPGRENSEIAAVLQKGNICYFPGDWTKEKVLLDAARQVQPDGSLSLSAFSDLIKIKVSPQNPLGQSVESPVETVLTLNDFIENGLSQADHEVYDSVEIIWPERYPQALRDKLITPEFREQYKAGDKAIEDVKQRVDELRQQHLEVFEVKFERYSPDNYLHIADIVTQYCWQDLIFSNDGTPIGFTEKDVLSKAIDFVEQLIIHNEGERDKLPPGDDWRHDYQTEVDKLFGVLKVLHEKQGFSLRLMAQRSVRDALIDTKVEAFVHASWKEKEQRISRQPQFENLTLGATMTLKLMQGNEVTRFSMPLVQVLGGEHERIATDETRVEVEWPSGLSTANPLLQELIDESRVYRAMQARGMDVQEAKDRIKLPTVMQQLQNGLERVVREEAPQGKKHSSLKLIDKVNVKFTPMVFYHGDPRLVQKAYPEVNKEFSLMQVMGKAPEREYIKMTSYRRMEVDTQKDLPAEVITGLRAIDWQRQIEKTIQELRETKQLAKDWELVFGSIIADKMVAAGASMVDSLTLNGCRLPGVYVLQGPGGIEMHSVFDETCWKFASLDEAVSAMNTAAVATTTSATQQDSALYAWLDEHRDVYYREKNNGGNYLYLIDAQAPGQAAQNVLGDLLGQMESDADTYLKSNDELNTHRVFQFLTDISPLIGLYTMPISGPIAFLVSVGLAALPFVELTVADTKEEFKEIAVQAAINAAFEVGPTIFVNTLSKLPAKQIAKNIAQKMSSASDFFKALKKAELQVPSVRLEPLRQLPTEKVGNMIPEGAGYLELLRKNKSIDNAIINPAGSCEALMGPVAQRIQQADIGMTNVRYRGMHIWSNATEEGPTNHFAVIGEKGGQTYVFDLSAHQFRAHMPDLEGPLILKEADWAQKYANASSRKLMRYKDYDAPLLASSTFHAMPGISTPKDLIDGATLLTAPQWYKTLTQWNPTGVAHAADDIVYAGLGRSSPLRDAARSNMLSGGSQGVGWDYASDVLRDADVLSPIQAKNLTEGLKKASNYQGMGNSGRVDNLVADVRSVTNNDELLRVKQGELVVFMEVDPNMPAKGARPVHAMTSLGNGRFAGMKNDVLDGQLGTGKSILTAEELGSFRDNGFYRIDGGVNAPALEIKVGYPMGAKVDSIKPIHEAAARLAREGSGAPKSWNFVADTLEHSGELAREQADAFRVLATELCDPPKNGQLRALKDLLVNPRPLVNLTELQNLPKGHVLAISNSEFSAKQLMLSLGGGKFASANLNVIDAGLPGAKAIVSAEELGAKMVNGKIGEYSLKAGPVNVEGMRVRSLLGRDSFFDVGIDKVLKVTVHGAPSIVNYMDASELSHVIRGLIKRKGTGANNPGSIRSVELNSCYGAIGIPSTGQALADILGKKVKAYPLRYSRKIEADPEWWRPKPKVFEPRLHIINNVEAMDNLVKQNMRNHGFWDKLLGTYKQARDAIVPAPARVARSAEAFDDLLKDASDLVMRKQGANVESFVATHPEYKLVTRGDVPSQAAVNAELKEIVGNEKPDDAETFASRVMEVLCLTEDSFKMLDQYLSKED